MLVLGQPISSFRSFPKGSKAASLLLYSLWNDKNLQAAIKKVNNTNIHLQVFITKSNVTLVKDQASHHIMKAVR